jgi:transcriptional regulator with XRE-family HTH domain
MLDDVMAGRPATRPAPLFGQRLAAARKERGLTQAVFAERLGISRPLMDYYERRAPNPSLEFIQRAAAVLGVEPSYFVDDGAVRKKKPGPPSDLELRLERLRKLPRSKQELIIAMLDAALDQAGAR